MSKPAIYPAPATHVYAVRYGANLISTIVIAHDTCMIIAPHTRTLTRKDMARHLRYARAHFQSISRLS